MTERPGTPLARLLRNVLASAGASEAPDAELLTRFLSRQDDGAFKAILRRHGPMVLAACRRLLPESHDAEDAFQATFVVLVRKAHSLRQPELLGSWLYGVAHRTARKVRTAAARRRTLESKTLPRPTPDPLTEAAERDLAALLDEEVSRLPEKYRIPFVLSHLEGLTHEEVSRRLGCPRETVTTRLVRARERLRARLVRRGVAVPAAGAALLWCQNASAVPETLLAATAGAARRLAAGGAISPHLIAITEGVLQSMKTIRVTTVLFGLLAVGVVGGLAAAAHRWWEEEPIDRLANRVLKGERKDVRRHLVQVASRVEGVLLFVGSELKKNEKPPADRLGRVTIRRGGIAQVYKYRRLREGDLVRQGQLLGRLDDELARNQVEIQEAKLRSSQADARAARALAGYYGAELRRAEGLKARKGIAEAEYAIAQAQWAKAREELATKEGAIQLAEVELRRAQIMLEMHEIRSPACGVLKRICRYPGEAVRKLEPVFVIHVSRPRR
jgi:RNA polymerase sigma factor (sigma-70 family)